MSKLGHFYLLDSRPLVFGAIMVLLFTIGGSAYATNYPVVIANGTVDHCLPYLSCYKPYEVDISPGNTVTWINNDNRTHTATSGTPNGGPVASFDSGPILPGHSYTQFFGTMGKFSYYDKTDMWPSGIVVVSNQGPSNAQIGWVGGSLQLASQGVDNGQKLVMTKQIENTGGTNANPVFFRLRILNDSGFLFYDTLLNGSVPARQNSSVIFTWNNPQPGNYRLNFIAENPAKQSNENTEFSSDLISLAKTNSSRLQPIVTSNYTISPASTPVPEFGQVSFAMLLVSIISVIAVSARRGIFYKV